MPYLLSVLHLCDQLQLHEFYSPLLPLSPQHTLCLNVLKTLLSYPFIYPRSEWQLHPQYF